MLVIASESEAISSYREEELEIASSFRLMSELLAMMLLKGIIPTKRIAYAAENAPFTFALSAHFRS